MPAGHSVSPTSDMPVSKPNPIPPSAPAQAPVAEPSTVELLGIELALTDYERTLDWIDAMVESRRRAYVIPAAVHCMMVAQRIARRATPSQGAPRGPRRPAAGVGDARMLGHPIASRVYGPELMARYCERAASTGTRMFLYGGRNQGALVQLALNLRRRYPGHQDRRRLLAPFRELTMTRTRRSRTRSTARAPTSSGWASACPSRRSGWRAMRDRLDAPVLIGVGAAFDFHAGWSPRRRAWMQELGLEWAYRLAHEPRRLWRRYARYNPRFVAAFARQWAQHQRRR